MPQAAVPTFLPSANGLHFPNAFPHEPLAGVTLPWFGQVRIGDAANGLCGGMAFTVRDLFEAHISPDAETSPPPAGSPRFEYLVRRLIDSFGLPLGPMRYIQLMEPALPDNPRMLGGFGLHGRPWVMIEEAWPQIRADIDGGHPSPLGLIRVISSDPQMLGLNHQVLAYWYSLDGSKLTIGVYDPNHPDDDTISLSLDTSNPVGPTPVTYSAGDAPVYCFIRSDYTSCSPDPWLPAQPQPRPGPHPV